jgi:hypothetical protein
MQLLEQCRTGLPNPDDNPKEVTHPPPSPSLPEPHGGTPSYTTPPGSTDGTLAGRLAAEDNLKRAWLSGRFNPHRRPSGTDPKSKPARPCCKFRVAGTHISPMNGDQGVDHLRVLRGAGLTLRA